MIQIKYLMKFERNKIKVSTNKSENVKSDARIIALKQQYK